ncbi:hypothetical protein L209DRAFT_727620 [Thermothelomyces heterothallicus CBS 203.75]
MSFFGINQRWWAAVTRRTADHVCCTVEDGLSRSIRRREAGPQVIWVRFNQALLAAVYLFLCVPCCFISEIHLFSPIDAFC